MYIEFVGCFLVYFFSWQNLWSTLSWLFVWKVLLKNFDCKEKINMESRPQGKDLASLPLPREKKKIFQTLEKITADAFLFPIKMFYQCDMCIFCILNVPQMIGIPWSRWKGSSSCENNKGNLALQLHNMRTIHNDYLSLAYSEEHKALIIAAIMNTACRQTASGIYLRAGVLFGVKQLISACTLNIRLKCWLCHMPVLFTDLEEIRTPSIHSLKTCSVILLLISGPSRNFFPPRHKRTWSAVCAGVKFWITVQVTLSAHAQRKYRPCVPHLIMFYICQCSYLLGCHLILCVCDKNVTRIVFIHIKLQYAIVPPMCRCVSHMGIKLP